MVPAKMGLPEGVASGPYDVRSGSKANIDDHSGDVCLTPKGGHGSARLLLPLCANFRRAQGRQSQPACTANGARHLRRNGKTDRGAPRVRRGKAAWNCVDCYAGRLEMLFHAVFSRLIIDFHR
jgi:hypothetical protein